jgi:hypothetical protein
MTPRRSSISSLRGSVLAPLCGLLLGILLGLGLYALRRTERAHRAEGAGPELTAGTPQAAAHTSATAGAAGSATSSESRPVEQLPVPPCWEGLFELDEHASLASLKQALIAAVGSGDPLLLSYLEQRLAEVIGGDATSALAVIGWARESGPPLSSHLLAAVKGAAAVQQGAVAEQLAALGADGKQSPELRRAALEALESQRSLGPALLGRLKGVAMDEHSDEAAWTATRTIGRVMTEEAQRGGATASYMKELLDIGQHSSEAGVRSLALEMPSYGNIPVERSALPALGQILSRDPDRAVREMAAFRLGLSRDADQSLSLLSSSFEGERDLCVRWAIFRFAVRAAGAKALPLLDKLSTVEPRLRPDYEDFRAIYARGTTDFARVWLEKPERIHCEDEES